MQIIFDGREAFSTKKTGKGQWTLGVIQEAILQGSHCIIFTTKHALPEASLGAKICILPSGILFHVFAACTALFYPKAMYCSSTSFITPCVFYLFPFIRVLVIVHDTIAFQPGQHSLKARIIENITLRFALYRANKIATVSTSTKNDLTRMYSFCANKNLVVCYAAAECKNITQHRDAKNIVCVATLSPRKNQLRLLNAFNSLPENVKKKHPLILAGGTGWNYQDILVKIKHSSHVTYKGYVAASEYKNLLQSAYIFAFPSLYEGFGLPVLDAFSVGVPVLTSKMGSLEEIAAEAALCIDPLDTDDIARGLLLLCTDSNLYHDLQHKGQNRAKQFTWEKTYRILFTK